MNHHSPSPVEGLFKSIARCWTLPAPAATMVPSADGTILAIARADGALSLVPLSDPEPPDSRIHVSADTGRATIRMRQGALPPAIATAPLSSRTLPMVPCGRAGFLVADAEGRLLKVAGSGEVTSAGPMLPCLPKQMVRSPESELVACACGPELLLLRQDGGVPTHVATLDSAVTTLAFSPDGQKLAVGTEGALAIFDLSGQVLRKVALKGTPSVLSWHAASVGLVAALGAEGLATINLITGNAAVFGSFPTPVQSLGWSRPARAFVAAGAFRIAAWAETALTSGDNRAGVLVTGHPGLVPVQVVAAHPTLPLAAAGYVNGQVVVAPIGRAEELPVQPVGASVVALTWTADGQLVSACADGGLAIMTFPSNLFKVATPRTTG